MEEEKIEEEREKISKILSERLEAHDESRKASQEKLHGFCEDLKAQIDRLEERINSELEEKFTAEDSRLQTILSELSSSGGECISKMIQKAKAELLVEQTYDVVQNNPDEEEDYEDESEESDENNENEDESDESEEEPARKKMKVERGGNDEGSFDLSSLYELKTERKVASLELIGFEGGNQQIWFLRSQRKGNSRSPSHSSVRMRWRL